MRQNVGNIDQVIRLILAFAIITGLYMNAFGMAMSYILGLLALAMLATSMTKTCPLYSILNISTRKKVRQ